MQFIVGAYFLQFGGYFLTKYYFPKLKPLETLKLYKIVQNNPLCPPPPVNPIFEKNGLSQPGILLYSFKRKRLFHRGRP